MGMNLKNIITDFTSAEDLRIMTEIESSFQFAQVKQFDSQFKGIVGQINEAKLENAIYREEGFLAKHGFSDEDEFYEKLMDFEDEVVEFSKKFPEKLFAYVGVDCFGGTCMYDGLVAKNGEIVFHQEPDYAGHVNLLQQINRKFKKVYFEPFTRDFFTKKGEIKGMIKDFTIAGLWLALKTDYPDTKRYYVDGGAGSLILRCHGNYYYYFEARGGDIEVTGVIYQDDETIMQEIVEVPDNSFMGMEYEVEIDFLEKKKRVKKSSSNSNDLKRKEEDLSRKGDRKKLSFWRRLKGE